MLNEYIVGWDYHDWLCLRVLELLNSAKVIRLLARSMPGVLRAQYNITTVVGSSAFVVFSHRSLPWLIRKSFKLFKESGKRKAFYKPLMS